MAESWLLARMAAAPAGTEEKAGAAMHVEAVSGLSANDG
jgi:hypothetical protein